MKVVSINDYYYIPAQEIIGYHCNVSWIIAKRMPILSSPSHTNCEHLVKIGRRIDREIFSGIFQFLAISQGYKNEPRDLCGYWTESYQISRRCSVLMPLLQRPATLRDSNPFRTSRPPKQGGFDKSAQINCHGEAFAITVGLVSVVMN